MAVKVENGGDEEQFCESLFEDGEGCEDHAQVAAPSLAVSDPFASCSEVGARPGTMPSTSAPPASSAGGSSIFSEGFDSVAYLEAALKNASDADRELVGEPGSKQYTRSLDIIENMFADDGAPPDLGALVVRLTAGEAEQINSVGGDQAMAKQVLEEQVPSASIPAGSSVAASSGGPAKGIAEVFGKLRSQSFEQDDTADVDHRSRPKACKPSSSASRKPSPVDKAKAEGMVVDSEEVAAPPEAFGENQQWHKEMPLVLASIDAALPTGSTFTSLKRIRGTINQYSMKTTKFAWFADMKVATVQSLTRRLLNHEEYIVGKYHIDVQIGYMQLKHRLAALLSLHKTMRVWVETQDDAKLLEVMAPMHTILKFLDTQKLEFAPDLALVLVYAQFHQEMQKNMSLSSAMKRVSFEALHEIALRAQRHVKQSEAKIARVKMKMEVDEEAGEGDHGASPAKGKIKKPRFATIGLTQRIDFHSSALTHFAKLVTSGLKLFLFDLPAKFFEVDAKMTAAFQEMQDMCDAWAEVVKKAKDDDFGKEFLHLLQGVDIILKCCHPDESARPTSADVRWARRVVLDALNGTGLASEVAKAMMSYNAGKVAMASAKSHSASGLEDEAANTMFKTVIESFEKSYEKAFENLDQWIASGNNDLPQDMASIGEAMEGVHELRECLSMCLPRWPTTALEENLENLEVAISNGMEIVIVGNIVLVADFLARCFAWVGPLVAEHKGPCTESEGSVVKSEEAEGENSELAHQERALMRIDSASLGMSREWVQNIIGMRSLVATIKVDVESLVSNLQKAAEGFDLTCSKLAERLGQGRFQPPTDASSTSAVLQDIKGNSQMMLDFLEHLDLCGKLVADFIGEEQDSQQKHPMTKKNTLVPFAKHHQKFKKEPLALQCAAGSGKSGEHLLAEGNLDLFVQGSGSYMFTFFATSFVQVNAQTILQQSLKLTPVHEKVLSDIETWKLFTTLVQNPSVEELAAYGLPKVEGVNLDEHSITNLDHNVRHTALEEFIVASGYEEIPIDEVYKLDSDKIATMPSADGLVLLESRCLVLDVLVLAGALHEELLSTTTAKNAFTKEFLFGRATMLCSLFGQSIVKLDTFLDSEGVLNFEKQGWRLEVSISCLRQWRGCMSTYGGRAQQALLMEFVELLTRATEACKSQCPSIEACFDKGALKMQVASKVLSKKLGKVVATHNSLHQVLTSMNMAAKALQISPRLQESEATSESVAVALACLSRSAQAFVLIMGVELLALGETDPQGSSKAKAFIQQHKISGKNDDILESFWAELQNLADHATIAPSPTKPSEAGHSTTPKGKQARPLKRELLMAGSASSAASSSSKVLAPQGHLESNSKPGSANADVKTEPGGRSLKRFRK